MTAEKSWDHAGSSATEMEMTAGHYGWSWLAGHPMKGNFIYQCSF